MNAVTSRLTLFTVLFTLFISSLVMADERQLIQEKLPVWLSESSAAVVYIQDGKT